MAGKMAQWVRMLDVQVYRPEFIHIKAGSGCTRLEPQHQELEESGSQGEKETLSQRR